MYDIEPRLINRELVRVPLVVMVYSLCRAELVGAEGCWRGIRGVMQSWMAGRRQQGCARKPKGLGMDAALVLMSILIPLERQGHFQNKRFEKVMVKVHLRSREYQASLVAFSRRYINEPVGNTYYLDVPVSQQLYLMKGSKNQVPVLVEETSTFGMGRKGSCLKTLPFESHPFVLFRGRAEA